MALKGGQTAVVGMQFVSPKILEKLSHNGLGTAVAAGSFVLGITGCVIDPAVAVAGVLAGEFTPTDRALLLVMCLITGLVEFFAVQGQPRGAERLLAMGAMELKALLAAMGVIEFVVFEAVFLSQRGLAMIAAKTGRMKQMGFGAHILFSQWGLTATAAFNGGHGKLLEQFA